MRNPRTTRKPNVHHIIYLFRLCCVFSHPALQLNTFITNSVLVKSFHYYHQIKIHFSHDCKSKLWANTPYIFYLFISYLYMYLPQKFLATSYLISLMLTWCMLLRLKIFQLLKVFHSHTRLMILNFSWDGLG